MNLKRSLGTVFLGLIAIGLLVAILAGFAVSATPSSQAAVNKTCEGKIEAKQYNPSKVEEPKNCPLKLVAKDFPLNAPTTVSWVIKTDPGNTVVMTGTISIGNDGKGETGELSRLENGDYKVYWTEAGCVEKNKAFEVENCVLPTATFTPTNTPTNTLTNTPTETPTNTPTETPTNAPTETPTNTPTETPTNTPTETGTPDPTATATLVANGSVVIIPDPNNGTITMIVSGFFECREVDWFVVTVPGDQVVVSGTISLNEVGAGTSGAVQLGVGNFRVIWFACQQEDAEPISFREQARAPISQVSVLCNGCWDNVAYLWVGGTEQTPQTLILDTEHSDPAALWVLWNIVPWEVRVKVSMPAGLDPLRWKFILWTGTGPTDYVWIDEASYTLNPFGFVQADFQLVDTAFWPQ